MKKKAATTAADNKPKKRILKGGTLTAAPNSLALKEFAPAPHLSPEQAAQAQSRFTLSYTLAMMGTKLFARAKKPEDYIQAYQGMNHMLYEDRAIGPQLMQAFGFTNSAKVGGPGEDVSDDLVISSANVFFHNAALMAKKSLDPDDAYADLKDEAGPGELLRQFSTLLRCSENMRSLTEAQANGRQLFLDEGEPGMEDYLSGARAAQHKLGQLLHPKVKR